MHLQFDLDHRNGYTVLSPQGEIDFATGPQLKNAITDVLVSGEVHVVVDLLRVGFIESTGLGALIGGRRRALALNGTLSIVVEDPKVLKVFRITGLDKVFTIVDTVEAATATPLAADDGGWSTPEIDAG
jgi:anti-sigma B factor antagonist